MPSLELRRTSQLEVDRVTWKFMKQIMNSPRSPIRRLCRFGMRNVGRDTYIADGMVAFEPLAGLPLGSATDGVES